jgi:hypothetical protein
MFSSTASRRGHGLRPLTAGVCSSIGQQPCSPSQKPTSIDPAVQIHHNLLGIDDSGKRPQHPGG